MIGLLFRWAAFAFGRARALTAAFALPGILLAPSLGDPHKGTLLGDAKERGALRMVTLSSPTTYFQGREGPAGLEYDLAKAYAEHLGVKLEVTVVSTFADVLKAVDEGKADFAAAGLSVTERGLVERRFTPSYETVQQVVVCREDGPAPADLDTLSAAEIVVAEASTYGETLRQLQAEGRAVSWREQPGASVQSLLSAVSNGEAPCTLADDHQLDLSHRYYPHLEPAVALPAERRLAWALGQGRSWRSASLERDMQRWFHRRATRDYVARLGERYFGFEPETVGKRHAAIFRRQMEASLPRYRQLFEAEAKAAGIPWTILAAVAYQESMWDPNARSPTGVRGMMMLTLPTARIMDVADRTDPAQSTRGGARYLKRLKDRLPDTITEDDRWWFAMAAYNMGWEHVMDARALAARLGKNPNRWSEVHGVLPMLNDPTVAADLRYGQADGVQAETYVRRIRDFADMLEKRFDNVEPDASPTLLAGDAGKADAAKQPVAQVAAGADKAAPKASAAATPAAGGEPKTTAKAPASPTQVATAAGAPKAATATTAPVGAAAASASKAPVSPPGQIAATDAKTAPKTATTTQPAVSAVPAPKPATTATQGAASGASRAGTTAPTQPAAAQGAPAQVAPAQVSRAQVVSSSAAAAPAKPPATQPATSAPVRTARPEQIASPPVASADAQAGAAQQPMRLATTSDGKGEAEN